MAEDLNSGRPRTNPATIARAGLKHGAAGLWVRRADHSATLPPVIRMHKFWRQQRLVKQVVSLILSIFVTLGTFHKRNWSCPQCSGFLLSKEWNKWEKIQRIQKAKILPLIRRRPKRKLLFQRKKKRHRVIFLHHLLRHILPWGLWWKENLGIF